MFKHERENPIFSFSVGNLHISKHINEREEFMQETQHTQQTATRTAQSLHTRRSHVYTYLTLITLSNGEQTI